MIFYVRAFLMFVWLPVFSVIGIFVTLYEKGRPDIVRDLARLFHFMGSKITGFRIELQGGEHLEAIKPCVYVENHQRGLDLITFGSMFPNSTVGVGKKEIKYIPFFGIVFVMSGNV